MPWLLQWEDELGKLDELLALLTGVRSTISRFPTVDILVNRSAPGLLGLTVDTSNSGAASAGITSILRSFRDSAIRTVLPQ
jgi:hypothetical protein